MSFRLSPFERALGRAASVATLALCLGVTQAQAQSAPFGLRAVDTAPVFAAADAATTKAEEILRRKARSAGKAGIGRNRRPPASGPLLPPLTIYPRANRIGLRGGAQPIDSDLAPPPTIAAIPPINARPRSPIDDRPFDPIGVQVGSLRLKPYFEEDFGYASNPASVAAGAKGSAFETSEAGLAFQSDWARHDLHGDLRGGYTDYFANSAANTPYGSGAAAGRFDISRDFSLDAETHFNLRTQTPGSVTLPSGAVLSGGRRPLVDTFGGSLGGIERLGKLALSLHGTFDRTLYDNARLSDGSVVDLSSDDSTDWGLRGRAAYEISPIVAPFVEVDADKRIYDRAIDSGGFQRDSRGAAALGGATLALTNQLTGEASAGYGRRNFRDPRLPDLSGPLFNASLVWAVTPLTTVRLNTTTSLADTTTPGASGAVTRSYTIGVSHALRRYLTLTANAGYTSDAYSGLAIHDQATTFGLGAEYSLSRELVLKASATRTQFTSSLPNSNYTANVFLLGLRVQR